jgi:hypothetical protein
MGKIAASLFVIACVAGCGDDGGKGANKDAAIDSKVAIDATPIDAAIDAPPVDAPPGTFPLKVKNYLSWCDVSVNGGTSSAGAEQTVNVLPGNIPLLAKAANATFEVSGNMWHHTTGDAGAGETGMVTTPASGKQSTAVAVVGSAAKCVWVCCPFVGGTGCENTIPDQCP